MLRLAIALAVLSTPVFATESKEASCGFQAQVIQAIQKARMDRVKESDVAAKIAASNPTWPAKYNAVIP
ncbi:MAG: hypothetical protein AAF408_06215, partial [Pseudomonadota bacterium]